MTVRFLILQICFCLHVACGEEINLYGDAGQAYSVEAYLGHPHQKLKLLVDTGSTTLAIASYARQNSKEYFHPDNSTSIYDSGKGVQAEYSQGMWSGRLISDFIQFPSLSKSDLTAGIEIPEVRSDIALITQSHKFFMNGSGWQGLLGLAYLPVGAWGEGVVVESWLDSVDRFLNKQISFQLKLCGPLSPSNTTHYGYFKMLDNISNENFNKTLRTPILRKRWYEVGVISIRVINPSTTSNDSHTVEDTVIIPNEDMCLKLNAEKGIVDSGTTNIKIPDSLYRQVVDELKSVYRNSQVLILDEFWYQGEAACWPEPQVWTLPWLAIDLLSADADNQYFTLEIPPQNYMRVVGVYNSSDKSGSVSEYCYKLGLEEGGTETVLGYTAMEGLQVLFNRSAGWIGWQSSDCGSNARITVPPIEKCPLSDSSCLKKSAQNALTVFAAGVPEVGSDPLEPVSIDIIKIDLSGLKLTVKDAEISGFGKTTIDKLKFDSSKKVMQLGFHAPVVLKGKYKAGGRLLILPISGDGDVTIRIKNLELLMTMPYEITKNENGKDVIDLKSFKYTYENKENTHFKLTNLFNGNKALSDTMHTFMNENWQAISQEFGNPMLVKPTQKIFAAIKTYLRSQPLEDITTV